MLLMWPKQSDICKWLILLASQLLGGTYSTRVDRGIGREKGAASEIWQGINFPLSLLFFCPCMLSEWSDILRFHCGDSATKFAMSEKRSIFWDTRSSIFTSWRELQAKVPLIPVFLAQGSTTLRLLNSDLGSRKSFSFWMAKKLNDCTSIWALPKVMAYFLNLTLVLLIESCITLYLNLMLSLSLPTGFWHQYGSGKFGTGLHVKRKRGKNRETKRKKFCWENKTVDDSKKPTAGWRIPLVPNSSHFINRLLWRRGSLCWTPDW